MKHIEKLNFELSKREENLLNNMNCHELELPETLGGSEFDNGAQK